ncbi:MAG: hypothetical protein J7500_15655 [Sphingomonas sp.]|uniref:hypothetical protein n=1 Tax=Sphingomonas sp. TaxID=28214 RepID=UPI001B148D7B|nr:hypothetical protein [Sphingomonas sp.]MBO9624143.1 hypothetical protein [Sphingomonas sp.]
MKLLLAILTPAAILAAFRITLLRYAQSCDQITDDDRELSGAGGGEITFHGTEL